MKAATPATFEDERFLVISIHAAREGGDLTSAGTFIGQTISIHAAREGGDVRERYQRCATGISIHAAREGGDCGNE